MIVHWGVPPPATADSGIADSGSCRLWRPIAVTDEERARRRVVQGLAERFDQLPRSLVQQAVNDAWSGLADGRVRDFVPILAARAASQVLRDALGRQDRDR